MEPTYLGIEIGGTKLQIHGANDQLATALCWRGEVSRGAGAAAIRAKLEPAIRSLRSPKLRAVAAGFGGPIDWRTGRIACSHHVGGWESFELAAWLADVAGVPAFADNDTNLATLGEARAGAGRGHRVVFYTNFGTGVGGGVAIDGEVYHGAAPGEVEFGHLRLDRSDTTVESRCSGTAIDQRLRAAATAHPESVLAGLLSPEPGGEARSLLPALQAGDPHAHAILDEFGQDLAFALSHVIHLFHPDILILGGGLSLVGDPLRDAVRQHLPRHVMQAFQPPPRIVLSFLCESAVPVGAIHLAHRRL